MAGDLGVEDLVDWLKRRGSVESVAGIDAPSPGAAGVGVCIGRAEGTAEGGMFQPPSPAVVAVFKLLL